MTKIPRSQSVAQFVAVAIKQMRTAADVIIQTQGRNSPEARTYNKQADELRVVYIAKRLQDGLKQVDIAAELDITRGRVSQIWNEHLRKTGAQA